MSAAADALPGAVPGALTHGVPAYFHPAESPALWARLRSHAAQLRFVVVNPASGAGDSVDEWYLAVTRELARAATRMVGYVDTDYGRRPLREVLDEAARYRERYGVTGIFLDQCASTLAALGTFESYATALRGAGTRFLVLNPGTHPHRAYVDLANVTVTFEGRWSDYRRLKVPDWVRDRPAERYCHLVHGVPTWRARRPERLVADHHVGTVCLTDGVHPNPWDRLPPALRDG